MIAKLVVVNLFKNPVRTLAGMAGIALGVSAMLSILAVMFGAMHMFKRILSNDTHILVFEKNVSDLFFSSVETAEADRLRTLPEVDSVNPRLFGLVSTEGHPVITCFGLNQGDPRLADAEWIQGDAGSFENAGSVVLGQRAAEFMGAWEGDEVEIGNGVFHVSGVIATENGFEDGGVFMPLATAQEFFHREGVCSVIALRMKDESKADEFLDSYNADGSALTALRNDDFSRNYSQFKILSATAWAVGGCAFLLGGMSVLNTMLMSVYTRIREIAIMRVCGFSRKQLFTLIIGESLFLGLLGLFVGGLIAVGVLSVLEEIPALQGYISPHFEGWMFVGVPILAFVTCVAGACYPAWLATQVQPTEALRYE